VGPLSDLCRASRAVLTFWLVHSINRLPHIEASVSSPRSLELDKPWIRLECSVEAQHRGTALPNCCQESRKPFGHGSISRASSTRPRPRPQRDPHQSALSFTEGWWGQAPEGMPADLLSEKHEIRELWLWLPVAVRERRAQRRLSIPRTPR
jgi:hypothetical protein